MGKRAVLRIISLCMFVIAAVFMAIAFSNPQLGSVIYIGDFKFGVEAWRICYAVYALVMIGLFIASFIVKKKSPNSNLPGRLQIIHRQLKKALADNREFDMR